MWLAGIGRADTGVKRVTLEGFFEALNQVEASGRKVNVAKGDFTKDGRFRARGGLQIWEPYFIDSRVKGTWDDCEGWDFSKQVVLAYFKRYESTALKNEDWQTLALLHHYGPGWKRQNDRHGYWEKVQKHLR